MKVQGLCSSEHRSLLGVNEDVKNKRNAEISSLNYQKLHLHAAADRYNLSCHIAAHITCKESCNVCNILWSTATA